MEAELLRDGSALPVTPTQQGDIWGVCSHHSCCNLLPVLAMAPHWSTLAVRAGITISSWQCLGNVWIDTHRAGQGGCSKGHFVVRGWACGWEDAEQHRAPGRRQRGRGHPAGDSEGGDTPLAPPLPARHRPAQPGFGDPCRFSCSSQPAPEELSPQLSSGQGQGTTEGLGSSIPRPGR